MKGKVRHSFLLAAILSIVGGLSWRLVDLQVVEQGFLKRQGDMRSVRLVSTSAYRGMITDRNGEPLAISTPVHSVWLNPKQFDTEQSDLTALASILKLSPEDIRHKVQRSQGKEFVYLRRHVTPGVADQIQLLNVAGVHLQSEYRRYYPYGEVSSHILGFTDVDEIGKEGLELAFNDWLSGKGGSRKVIRDRRGREVQVLDSVNEVEPGDDLTLSLDSRLQYLAYRELKSVVTGRGATAGSVVVLDVETGEVLAMANQPSFNPNTRIKLTGDDRYRNRAVTDVFEPASSIKPFSVASGLQYGGITAATMIDTSPGRLMVGKHVVKEDRNKNFGVIDVSTVLRRSSNVGVGKIVLAQPSECLLDTYRKVGFGQTTGSGFPGERAGTFAPTPKDGSFVLATMAFGYGISVTPLQLAQAYATLGNGGLRRPVSFVKQQEQGPAQQVMDSQVARQIREMLQSVVEEGGGFRAKVAGYHTAGKSGTSRKLAENGGYRHDSHIAVFAGLAPAANPRFAIVVMVDDPKGPAYYGGQVAAPLFSKVAAGALRIFNVPPDTVDPQQLRMAHVGKSAPRHE